MLAALSLFFYATPTYDPWAWILWGREIAHFDLLTEGGPSWKPLPVVFTTVFSVFGEDTAPVLWLLVARTGALLATAMTFRVAYRLGGGGLPGVLGGLACAVLLLTSFNFLRDAALGNSEALMVALVLLAFERHLDGHRDHALYFGFAAALLRPEVWPFLGLYGLFLLVREPALRLRTVLLGLLVPLLWFGPELWGSGQASARRHPRHQPQPGQRGVRGQPDDGADRALRRDAGDPDEGRRRRRGALGPVLLHPPPHPRPGARSVRRRLRLVRAGGGDDRGRLRGQQPLPDRLLGGLHHPGRGRRRVRAVRRRRAGRRASPGRSWARPVAVAVAFVGALALAAPVAGQKVDSFNKMRRQLSYETSLWPNLEKVIEAGGGKERLIACGGLYSGPYQTQMVAYELGVHGADVRSLEGTPPPGAAFRTRTVPTGPLVIKLTDRRYRQIARVGKWRIVTVPPTGSSNCPAASRETPRAPAGGRVSAG